MDKQILFEMSDENEVKIKCFFCVLKHLKRVDLFVYYCYIKLINVWGDLKGFGSIRKPTKAFLRILFKAASFIFYPIFF